MEKKIRFLVQQWKNGDVDPESKRTDAGSDASALDQELETIWQKAGSYKSKSFEPDVEANWKKFQSKIQENHTPENTTVRRLVPRAWLIAASIVALLATAWWVINPSSTSSEFNSLATNKRQTKKIELPDHSVVWLSNNSELSFDPNLKNSKVRNVKLRGEAYFEVQANPQKPFRIETPHGLIEVLGTSFNVRALKTEPQTEVQVMSGRVALMGKGDNKQRIEVAANYVGYIHTIQKQPSKVPSNNNQVFASTKVWRTRKIELVGRTLGEAQEIMRRYSDYRLEFSDPQLAKCIFTWNFELDNPESSLKLLAKTGDFHLDITSSTVFRLEGKACPK
ncbi:FecR family protein [Haliscomenobacter sp.]|uniref:FecR family protein n=1 Tax=Haliscomenobacter sp. TaxID=2717303 RepID=UPI0035944C26